MRGRNITVLAAMIALMAALWTPALAQDVTGDTDVIITKIEVAGAFEVDEEEILAVVKSAVGSKLSTETLQDDLQRIFDLGYFSEDVKASLAEFQGGARVTFRVTENPVINAVIFEGASVYTEAQLGELIRAKRNTILNSNNLRADVEAIENKYISDGYIAARVIDARIDAAKNLNIVISEGVIQAIKVAYVVVAGDELKTDEPAVSDTGKTKDYVITREMKIKPGDIYNKNNLGRDLQKIYNLGFFDDVHTRVDPGDRPGHIILVVEVEEGKTGSAGFGAGYSSNTGLTGFLTYSERNLKGKARRIDAKTEFGGKRDNFELGYFEPWLDKKKTSGEVNVYSTYRENLRYGLSGLITEDYEEIRRGFNMTFGRPISDFTRVFIGYKIENVKVTPEELYSYLDGSSRSVTGTIRTDTRDYIFNPTKGRYDSASLELNGGLLGGDYDYEKLTLEGRRYFPIRKNHTICGRVMIGLGQGGIPRFDYFDLGGVNTLRGYDEYQFGGTKMILYNLEYRIGLSGNLSAALFTDAGNAWMDASDMKFLPGSDMHRSYGVGLRLKIPALGTGPVRLDYAIAVEEKDSKLHFGFGHMF